MFIKNFFLKTTFGDAFNLLYLYCENLDTGIAEKSELVVIKLTFTHYHQLDIFRSNYQSTFRHHKRVVWTTRHQHYSFCRLTDSTKMLKFHQNWHVSLFKITFFHSHWIDISAEKRISQQRFTGGVFFDIEILEVFLQFPLLVVR